LGDSVAPTSVADLNAASFSGIAEESSVAARLSPSGSDLDTAKTLDRLGGDKPLFVKLLQRFRQSHEVSLKSLRQALDQDNRQSAILFAHTLASTAANIGASTLFDVAKTLETCLHKDDSAGALNCLTDLEMAASRSAQAVEKYLSEEVTAGESTDAAEENDWQDTANRLRQHIEADDSAALDLLGELRSALGPKLSAGQLFQRLEFSVSAYDFEQARTHLDALIRWVRETPVPPQSAD
jgi:two-component system sensor histidine kinase/response regulator